MIWTVKYRNQKQVEKAVLKMRPNVRKAFAQAVKDLQNEGARPHGWLAEELRGDLKGVMKLYLDYRHRMLYTVSHGILTIEIIEVTTRENAY